MEQFQSPSPSAQSLGKDRVSKQRTQPAARDMPLDHHAELNAEIARLWKQIEEISISSKFCMEQFAESDEDIQFFTRYNKMSIVFNIDINSD